MSKLTIRICMESSVSVFTELTKWTLKWIRVCPIVYYCFELIFSGTIEMMDVFSDLLSRTSFVFIFQPCQCRWRRGIGRRRTIGSKLGVILCPITVSLFYPTFTSHHPQKFFSLSRSLVQNSRWNLTTHRLSNNKSISAKFNREWWYIVPHQVKIVSEWVRAVIRLTDWDLAWIGFKS